MKMLSTLNATLLKGALLMSLTLAAAPAKAVTNIEEVESPGGITAWLVEDYTIPLITINFAFKGGAAQDEPGKEGVANLLTGLMDEGAGDLTAIEFQRRQQGLAMRMSFEAGRDGIFGTFQTIANKRDESLELLQLALNAPRFDEEPIERVRRQTLAGLQREARDPNAIVNRLLSEKAFGDHPYGRPTRGTMESVSAITREDLQNFVRRNFARDNLYISVVGAISAEELKPILDQVFGDLPEAADLTPVPDVEMASQGVVSVEPFTIPQSIIRFAMPGIKRDDEDFIPAYVLNHIFGGGTFSSRLFREVREARGLSYSVFSYLMPLNHSGLIVGGLSTRNDAANTAMDVVRQEIERIRNTPITEAELDEAKAFLKGSYQLRFDTSAKIARNLVGLQLENLGIDYIENRNDLIEAATVEDLERVAERLLNVDAMATVIVGQPEGAGG